MEDAIRALTEIAEHLVYSHTFRSEHTARRTHQLLAELRAFLAVGAGAATPAQEETSDDS